MKRSPRGLGARRPLPSEWSLGWVREAMRGKHLCVVVPAYGDGPGVWPTLDSIRNALAALELSQEPILLIDSSPDGSSVEAAQSWARDNGAHLVIDQTAHRRTKKAALNDAFDSRECRHADVVVQIDADIIFTVASFAALLGCLLDGPRSVAIGLKVPDPSARRLAQRAGAWQLRATARIARRSSEDELRAEGSFVALGCEFLQEFRYPIGEGAAQDDLALVSAIQADGKRAGNAWAAESIALPPGSVHDFALQTYRYYSARADDSRSSGQIAAGLREAMADPFGAVAYAVFRVLARGRRASVPVPDPHTDAWDRAKSTLR